MFNIALGYHRRGWTPIPIPHGRKGPTLADWPKFRVTCEGDLQAHFNGQPINVGVLLGMPSGGLLDIDLDCSEAVALAAVFLPETDAVFGRPGNPRSHRLYECEDAGRTIKFQTKDDGTIVEVRSTGAQTVFPGSTHPCGERIEWEREGKPARVSVEQLQVSVRRLAVASLFAKHWPPKGCRHDFCLCLAGALLCSESVPPDEVADFIESIAQSVGDTDPTAARDRAECVRDTREKLQENESVTGWPQLAKLIGEDVASAAQKWLKVAVRKAASLRATDRPATLFTELGYAERLVDKYGNSIRYCHALGWLVYDGKRWARDTRGRVAAMVKGIIKASYRELSNVEESKDKEQAFKSIRNCETANRVRGIAALAESDERIRINADDLDADPWVLNILNGTLDLRTTILRPHRPEDLISRLAEVTFDETAKAPRWEQFLNEVLDGDTDLIAFIQRAVGYTLTGDVSAQCLFMCHGGGANGKSVFQGVVRSLLGDYGTQADPSTFMAKRSDAVRNDIARLAGARYVACTETEEGRRLAESLVKQATGGDGDKLVARFLFKEQFEFVPAFKLWLSGNHKPRIQGTDYAIWRRIHLIPFNVTIPEERRDPELLDKLRGELPGILNWALTGLLAWKAKGLAPPDVVRVATNEYREESDTVREFIEDACAVDENGSVRVTELYKAYRDWCGKSEHPLKKQAFGKRLGELGFEVERRAGGERWRTGLRLRGHEGGLVT